MVGAGPGVLHATEREWQMLSVEFSGLKELRSQLTEFSDRRLSAAVATALTRTAVDARAEGQRFLRQALDRPKPFTINSLKYVPATAQRPVAAVGLGVVAITDQVGNVLRYQDLGEGERPAGKYLGPMIRGGQRHSKGVEGALRAAGVLPAGWFVVPGAGALLDAYGNVSPGQIVQILSQLRIQQWSGTTRNMSFEAGKQIAAQRKAGGRFFVVPVGSRQQPGVYQREFMGRNVTPVMIFVRGAVYRNRLDLPGTLQRRADEQLPREMARSIEEQLQRLAQRRTPTR
jgi:hypothetical protein